MNVFLRLVLLALFSLPCCSGLAHEFWIEPVKYEIDSGEALLAETVVGQLFAGDSRPYVSGYYQRLVRRNGNKTRRDIDEITGRLGDLPAIQVMLPTEGLHILGLHSSDSELLRTSFEGFREFLVEEGLEWGIERHRERGLPMQGFSEKFVRFAKALVNVGAGEGSDQSLGFRFEWIALSNPYSNQNSDVRLQLLLDAEPVPDKRVHVFVKSPDPGNPVQQLLLKTDESGVLLIKRALQGAILINAVHLEEIDLASQDRAVWIGTKKAQTSLPNAERAVWRSLWASMVFDLAGATPGGTSE